MNANRIRFYKQIYFFEGPRITYFFENVPWNLLPLAPPPPTSKDLRDRRSDVEVSNQIPGLSAREQPNFFPFLLVFLFLSFCSSRIPNPETRPAVSRITTNHPFSPTSAVLHLVTQSHFVFLHLLLFYFSRYNISEMRSLSFLS